MTLRLQNRNHISRVMSRLCRWWTEGSLSASCTDWGSPSCSACVRKSLAWTPALPTRPSSLSCYKGLRGRLFIWEPITSVPSGAGTAMVSPLSHSFFFFLIFFKIYFWLCWVFVAVRRLSLVAASGGYSSLRCMGFSLRWLLSLRSTGSRRVGFSSCGTQAQ